MKDALHKKLKPITEVQSIRGVNLPVGLEFRQLVVTGPPGAGKTYYINKIRGWPNEGYLDLTRRSWWKDQSLIYRPREIHLGIPYAGIEDALAVFDQEWHDLEPDAMIIDYRRIRIPPETHSKLSTNWRDRYIFEFLLPEPEIIFERRMNRQKDGYFPVDANLDLDTVARQLDVYSRVALFLHRAGLNVYIRTTIDQPPMLISEKGEVALPPWAVATIEPQPSLKTAAGWKQTFLRQTAVPWFTVTGEIQNLHEPSRIPHDGKSLDIIIGRFHLRLSPEIPLGARKKYLHRNKDWIIRKPESCSDQKIRGFARIKPGETVMLGRANKDYDDIFNFKKDVAKRHVTITNDKGDLIISPLDRDKKVKIVRLDDQDNREQMGVDRTSVMLEIRELFGGSVTMLEKDMALELIGQVNEILAKEPYR
ncbi:MAG: serine/threonine protein phosphatase, partial [Desulfofustis sp.]